MPRAIPVPVRQELVRRAQAGEPLIDLAQDLGLRYRTVRGLWRRYRDRGDAGLRPDYDRCARTGARVPTAVYEAALAYKRAPPRWGAPLIRWHLAQDFPAQPLPAVRTLQTWFRKAELQRPRTRQPAAPRGRGRTAHEVWELDAKEEIPLADGQRVAVFSVTDEATGAVLGAATFPPHDSHAGAGGAGAGLVSNPLHPLGLPGTPAGG